MALRCTRLYRPRFRTHYCPWIRPEVAMVEVLPICQQLHHALLLLRRLQYDIEMQEAGRWIFDGEKQWQPD